MFKFICSGCATGLALLMVSAAAADPAGLLSEGKLSVGLDMTYAPYSYFKDGEASGFDVETLKMIAEQMAVSAEFKDTRFEQVIIGVRGQQFDLTPGLYMTPERAKAVTLVPYFSAGSAIVVLASNDSAPQTEADLCGLKVSSIKGGAVVEKVRTETNPECGAAGKDPVEILEYPTDPEATQALLAGGVDAQLTEGIIAADAVAKTGERLKISSDELLYPVQVGWGIRKGNEPLAEALSKALEEISASGGFDDLLKTYGLSRHDPAAAKEAVEGAQ